jgi:hypothetical protein
VILGFTGTQIGMTDAQRRGVREILIVLQLPRFGLSAVVHGDCIGADDDFDAIAVELGLARIHRPTFGAKRAFGGKARPAETLRIWPAKPPLERNRDIVGEVTRMLATPKGPEETRSGTWSTIRYARRLRRFTQIVWPDGRVVVEGL